MPKCIIHFILQWNSKGEM